MHDRVSRQVFPPPDRCSGCTGTGKDPVRRGPARRFLRNGLPVQAVHHAVSRGCRAEATTRYFPDAVQEVRAGRGGERNRRGDQLLLLPHRLPEARDASRCERSVLPCPAGAVNPRTDRAQGYTILEATGPRAPGRREYEHAELQQRDAVSRRGRDGVRGRGEGAVHLRGRVPKTTSTAAGTSTRENSRRRITVLFSRTTPCSALPPTGSTFRMPSRSPGRSILRSNTATGNEEIADYSSTAYWYQLEPHRAVAADATGRISHPAPGRGSQRRDRSRRAHAHRKRGARPQPEDMSPYGAEWSGLKQLLVLTEKRATALHLRSRSSRRRRTMSRSIMRVGPAYGNVDVQHDGQKVGIFQGICC